MKKILMTAVAAMVLLFTQVSVFANIPFYVVNLSSKVYSLTCNTPLGGVVKTTPTRGAKPFFVLSSANYQQASQSQWTCVVTDANGATASTLRFLLPNFGTRAMQGVSSLLFSIGINGSLSYTEQKRA